MNQDEYNEGIETNASEADDLESTPSTYEVITYPADFTLEGLVAKYKKGTMIVPGFQRNYVWNIKQASRLIESFLLGLPVPAIFLFTDDAKNEQLVIDGQQRLKTLVYYFEGYFGEPVNGKRKVFKLTGLNEKSPFFNKTYKDLEETKEAAFNKLNDSVLRAFVVKQLTPDDNTSIYHIFERLNTGGTQLVGQEIRNCVYHGEFNNLLCELNALHEWRLIFGSEILHKRQKDVELILRFLSFHFNGDKYQRPIKDFMSNFMAKHQNANSETLEKFKNIFIQTCDTVLTGLGKKPFHIWSGFNVAAYDSVFTILSHIESPDHSRLADQYLKLKNDEKFISGVRGATADEKIVRLRMSLAKQYFSG
jgi:uncharacterized protein with ParB-like and HNH nuclease domain